MDYFGEEEGQVVQGRACLAKWTLACAFWTEVNGVG